MDFVNKKFKKGMDERRRMVLIMVKKRLMKPFRVFDKFDSRS